uniref:EKC/KEOPS complex subunit CGI121 n=1 Tax=Oryzias sinensis TaxID=183150 RepID=A0A8C7YHV1_9TELE
MIIIMDISLCFAHLNDSKCVSAQDLNPDIYRRVMFQERKEVNSKLLCSQMFISEAFKRFGISHQDRSLLVVVVHSRDDSEVLSHIAVRVDGQEVPVEEFSSFSDPAKIRKLYKVSPQEEESGGLLDAVVCRMATKDVM